MNKTEAREHIKSEKYSVPFDVWEFTPLDRACVRMVIRGTWIFDTKVDVNLIKDALGKTLSYYPHLAGRMKNRAGITLTNEGAPFSIADEPDLLVEEVLERDDETNIKFFSTEVKPARMIKGLDAPLSAKVTRLKNGSVLGVQCSHACMDGDSFYTMVYNWGKICKNEPIDKPVLDQSLFPRPDDIPAGEVKAAALEAGWKKLSFTLILKVLPLIVTGVARKRSRPFYISTGTIDRLKEKISSATGRPCSSNLALSALITKRCLELYNHDEDTRCSVVTVVNTRNRLAGIPATYAGNSSFSIATPAFAAGADIEELAAIIGQTLERIRKSPSPVLQNMMQLNLNVMKHKLPLAPFNIAGMLAKKPTIVYLNNFSRLHIYDIDFGSGIPVRVIPHDLQDQVVIWPAPPGSGGVEIYLAGIPTRYVNPLENDFFNNN